MNDASLYLLIQSFSRRFHTEISKGNGFTCTWSEGSSRPAQGRFKGRPWSLGFTPRTLPLTCGPPGPWSLVPGTWSNTHHRCGSMELTAAQGSPAPEDALLLGRGSWPGSKLEPDQHWWTHSLLGPTGFCWLFSIPDSSFWSWLLRLHFLHLGHLADAFILRDFL